MIPELVYLHGGDINDLNCTFCLPILYLLDANLICSIKPVIANSATIRCFGVCFAAHAVKFFVSEWLRTLHLS